MVSTDYSELHPSATLKELQSVLEARSAVLIIQPGDAGKVLKHVVTRIDLLSFSMDTVVAKFKGSA